jgi:hypothetical protein
MVALACHPSFLGNLNRRIEVQARLDRNVRPYLKNKAKRARSVLQVEKSQAQGPEFTPQYLQEN